MLPSGLAEEPTQMLSLLELFREPVVGYVSECQLLSTVAQGQEI
jgi:hypothetical protein